MRRSRTPPSVAKADFVFYVEAGQLEGPADRLKVEDFWDLGRSRPPRRSSVVEQALSSPLEGEGRA